VDEFETFIIVYRSINMQRDAVGVNLIIATKFNRWRSAQSQIHTRDFWEGIIVVVVVVLIEEGGRRRDGHN
tara:strand:+ start:214 stop:426 length:213 start_codon:yes stop_codon:yes gene_type:complete